MDFHKLKIIIYTVLTLLLLFVAGLLGFCVGLIRKSCQCTVVKFLPEDVEDSEMRTTNLQPFLSNGNKCLYKLNFDKPKTVTPKQHPGISAFPFLVSLSRPTYVDDPSGRIFASNGIIVDRDLVLIINFIIQRSDFLELIVRSDSNYWSKSGQEHKVLAYYPYPKIPKLVLVKVQPSFKFSPSFYPARIPTYEKKYNFFTSLGWNSNRDHLRYDIFRMTRWQNSLCLTCQEALVTTRFTSCRVQSNGEGLISGRDLLIGILLGHNCKLTNSTVFYNLQNRNFMEWFFWIKSGKRDHSYVDNYEDDSDFAIWSSRPETDPLSQQDYDWILDLKSENETATTIG